MTEDTTLRMEAARMATNIMAATVRNPSLDLGKVQLGTTWEALFDMVLAKLKGEVQ